jgi:microcystin degradation protein MlrC
MQIVIAECKQEVSTFNPAKSGYEDFVIRQGQEILDFNSGLDRVAHGASTERGHAVLIHASVPAPTRVET